jgi:hypothetical protein
VARATGAQDYNILQNNGRKAHQVVDHVRESLFLLFCFYYHLFFKSPPGIMGLGNRPERGAVEGKGGAGKRAESKRDANEIHP